MQRSQLSDEQIVAIVREAESGTQPSELARRHGVSKNTIGRWRAEYHGLEVQEDRRLKAVEDENRRLKKLVAAQALDLSLLKDLVGRKW